MDSYAKTFGTWQGYARSGAAVAAETSILVPTPAAVATGLSFAATDAVNAGLGRPQAMRTHKSITRPGSPPRGRLR